MSEVDDALDPNPCSGCMKWEIEGQHACFWCIDLADLDREEMDGEWMFDPYG